MSLRRGGPKQWLILGLGLLLSGLALGFLLSRVDGTQLVSALRSANPWILSGCLLTKGAVLALNATRTRILLLPLRRYKFVDCFIPWLSGYVTDNLLPFRLGELVRIDLLARAGEVSRSSTIAVVGLDRLIDLMSMLLLFAVAAPLLTFDLARADRLAIVTFIMVAGLALALWLATHPSAISRGTAIVVRPLTPAIQQWVVEKAQRFSEGLGALRSRSMIATVMGITLVARLVGMLTIQCWLWAFDLSLPLYAPLIVLLFISIGTMIPSSPGFIGTFHLACAYSLELMGVEPGMAASVAIVGHFMATVPWTVGGLFVCLPGIRRVWQNADAPLRRVEQTVGV